VTATLCFAGAPGDALTRCERDLKDERDLRDKAEYKEVTVRGEVVCLNSGKPRRIVEDRPCEPPQLGFIAESGKRYTFWPKDSTGLMLADQRVNKYQLQLTARLHPKDQLENIRILAVREGRLYDLFYFCDVCNITAYAPGPCPCCYQELEFIERPASNH
jgi:hypothetical protein